jgi:putative transposase
MRKSRFSEDQIIGILKEQRAGLPVAELCRKHGISDATFYTWRSKYGGMEASDRPLRPFLLRLLFFQLALES